MANTLALPRTHCVSPSQPFVMQMPRGLRDLILVAATAPNVFATLLDAVAQAYNLIDESLKFKTKILLIILTSK